MNMPPPEIIALHGAPRSGTSWMGQIFNSSESVAYRYQPFFSHAFRGRVNVDSGTTELRSFFDTLLKTEDDFVLQRGPASLSGRSEPFKKSDVTHLVYKEVRFHHLLPALLAKLREIRALGLVRDPRAVLWSWCRAPREFDAHWSMEKEWRTAQRKNRGLKENWYGFDRWKELTSLFLELRREYPERFRIFKYEDLLSDTLGQVALAFEFCGLEVSEQTEDFVRKSTTSDDQDPYGVYRLHADPARMSWRDGLHPDIQQAIVEDLSGTPLEQFLSRK